jgi:outer membrane protein TolC
VEWPPKTLDLADASLIAGYFNPSLEVARAKIRSAEATMVAAGARPNPEISAAGGYETAPEAPLVIRFQLSLPIETARKRTYRILEAAKLADASRISLNEASWRVYRQVRDAWVDQLSSIDVAEAFRRESRIREQTVSVLRARLSVGEASRPEWNAARTQASQAVIALKEAEGQVTDARIRLAYAMGLPASALSGTSLSSDTYAPPALETLSLARVQRKGLLNRLDIQRNLLEYAAAEAHLQLEVARQYPDIQLNPGYDFEEGFHKFTFGPMIPVPIWNRNRGPIAEAEAKRAEAEAVFLALQSQVITEIERSVANYRTALSQFQELDQRWSVIQADRERAALHAVQVGEEDQVSLLTIRLETAGASRARANALARARLAFAALEDAVQAPLDSVPWILPAAATPRQREGK